MKYNKGKLQSTKPDARLSSSRTDIETLNVRLPLEVLSMLDQLVEKKLFSSRSEAIREFCREYVKDNRTYVSQNTQENSHTKLESSITTTKKVLR